MTTETFSPDPAQEFPSKDFLERQKLQMEIKLLRRWYTRPEWLALIFTILSVVITLTAGFLSKENLIQEISRLKTTKDSLTGNRDSLLNQRTILLDSNQTLHNGMAIANDSLANMKKDNRKYDSLLSLGQNALARNSKAYSDLLKNYKHDVDSLILIREKILRGMMACMAGGDYTKTGMCLGGFYEVAATPYSSLYNNKPIPKNPPMPKNVPVPNM